MREFIQQIAQILGSESLRFRPFDVVELLSDLENPLDAQVTEYFETCVPDQDFDLDGIHILSAARIKEENMDMIPGCLCLPFGFVTIATTESGDDFAMDVQTGRVHLLSHEKFDDGKIEPGWNAEFSNFLPPLPITKANIVLTAEASWDCVPDFLKECLNHVIELETECKT